MMGDMSEVPVNSKWVWRCPRCQAELRPGSSFCHQCGVNLKGSSSTRLVKAQRILMIVSWIVCILGWAFIFLSAETVLLSGPVLLLLGLSVLIIGIILKHPASAFVGGSQTLICLLFFFLVVWFHWSPREAQDPFLWMGAAYILGMVFPGLLAFRLPKPMPKPWECGKCGYLLFGLTEPRCPECGTGFDPSLIGQMTPPGMEQPAHIAQ